LAENGALLVLKQKEAIAMTSSCGGLRAMAVKRPLLNHYHKIQGIGVRREYGGIIDIKA